MISVENLSLQIRGKAILEGVSFTLKPGEYVGLIGPNGAGKTSLIQTILGLYTPTKGRISRAKTVRMGYVPQRFFLSKVVPISVREVLYMAGVKAENKLRQGLKKVGLDGSFLRQNFHTLSGGEQQRVVIARALCQNPNLLLFDEPLTGVDYATKIKIYELLSALNKAEGMTILFVSHEVDQVIATCHRVLCLDKTMHTGCHPMDFAKGKTPCGAGLGGRAKVLPVHHHHPINGL